MPYYSYFPTELRLASQKFLDNITLSALSQPRAYIEVFDTVTSEVVVLATCTAFSVRYDLGAVMEGFSCTIDAASIWNQRGETHKNLLNSDIKKRVRIYYGQQIGGKIEYVKIFTGIITNVDESYQYGDAMIQVSGKTLAYLLYVSEGTFLPYEVIENAAPGSYWMDGCKSFIAKVIEKSSLTDYLLSFDDTIPVSSQVAVYDSALSCIHAFSYVLGPTIDIYMTSDGVFVMDNSKEISASSATYWFTESDIIKFDLTEDTDNVTTVVNISVFPPSLGGNSYLLTDTASQDMLDRYGEISKSMNNSLVKEEDQALNLMPQILAEGRLHQNIVTMVTKLNPYMQVGEIIMIEAPNICKISSVPAKVVSVSYSYSFGNDATMTIGAKFASE